MDGALLAEVFIHGYHFLREPFLVKRTVLMIHIVHVVLAGIELEFQLWIVLCQLQQFVLHGEDAADDDGALGFDDGTVAEDAGEPVVHALGYQLMLDGP